MPEGVVMTIADAAVTDPCEMRSSVLIPLHCAGARGSMKQSDAELREHLQEQVGSMLASAERSIEEAV